jgi:Ca2+-transporting ATPase
MILGPVHIAFLELIIDPACSIVFEQEPVEAGIMSRPPRPAAEGLFEKSTVRLSLLQGLGVLLTLLAIFAIALYRGQGEDDARALTFTSLAVMNLSIIATNRSALRHLPSILRSKNNSFWWVVAATFVLLGLILYVPALRTLFRFSVLHPLDIVLCLSTGVVGLAWMEALKWFSHRSRTSPTGHI